MVKDVFTKHNSFPCFTCIMYFKKYYHRKYLNPAEIPIFPVPVLTALNSAFVLINFFQCTLTYDPVYNIKERYNSERSFNNMQIWSSIQEMKYPKSLHHIRFICALKANKSFKP